MTVSKRLSVLILITSALVAGCASVPERNPVPEDLVNVAVTPVNDYARMWGDELPSDSGRRQSFMREQMQAANDASFFAADQYALSLSGGGAKGAFGAGLLKGWSEAGDRPEFLVVTGISTGALIAPFAFLGGDYDQEMEDLFTGISTSDLVKKRSLLKGLTGDAMTDTQPLRDLLVEHVDAEMIAEIAEEYSKGRRLLIGTTNLDARRPVIWNIGKIAVEGTDEAAQLIRDVMLASASIPGAFPPVRIQVVADGETYDELHVDGGTSSQVFLYPAQMDLGLFTRTVGISGQLHVYVIRNAMLEPRWSAVNPKLMPVLMASIDTLIRTQGMGDLYRIYLGALRDKIEFRLASIPPEFDMQPKETFDPDYMRALFDLAYGMAQDGYPWMASPPGVDLQIKQPLTAE
jgi:predicted acylesterase/phospholipase RssA